MPTKPIYASLTLWFNVAAGIYEVLVNTGVLDGIPAEYRIAVSIIGNVLLRVRTDRGVSLT